MITAEAMRALEEAPKLFKDVLMDSPNPLASFVGTIARLKAMEIALLSGAKETWEGKMDCENLKELKNSAEEAVLLYHVLSGAIRLEDAQIFYKEMNPKSLAEHAMELQKNAKMQKNAKTAVENLDTLDEILRNRSKGNKGLQR